MHLLPDFFSLQPLNIPLHTPKRRGNHTGCGQHTGTDVTPGLWDLNGWGDLLFSKQHACLIADGPCNSNAMFVCAKRQSCQSACAFVSTAHKQYIG